MHKLLYVIDSRLNRFWIVIKLNVIEMLVISSHLADLLFPHSPRSFQIRTRLVILQYMLCQRELFKFDFQYYYILLYIHVYILLYFFNLSSHSLHEKHNYNHFLQTDIKIKLHLSCVLFIYQVLVKIKSDLMDYFIMINWIHLKSFNYVRYDLLN